MYYYFILHNAPLVSHTHFIFRKVFPIYSVCELVCLNVENYIVRFYCKTNTNVVGICFWY